MIFTREGKILCEIAKWEKPKETNDNGIKIKRREAGQN